MPLPTFKRFRPAGTEAARRDELAQLERNAGDFADDLVRVLARGLTFADHFRGAVRPLEGFQQPASSTPEAERPRVTLGEGFRGVPVAVWLADARGEDGEHFSGLPVRWREDMAGQFPAVRVLEVIGLPTGQPFRLLLFVQAG